MDERFVDLLKIRKIASTTTTQHNNEAQMRHREPRLMIVVEGWQFFFPGLGIYLMTKAKRKLHLLEFSRPACRALLRSQMREKRTASGGG